MAIRVQDAATNFNPSGLFYQMPMKSDLPVVMKDVTSRDEITVQLLQSDFFGHSHDRSWIVLTFLGYLS